MQRDIFGAHFNIYYESRSVLNHVLVGVLISFSFSFFFCDRDVGAAKKGSGRGKGRDPF